MWLSPRTKFRSVLKKFPMLSVKRIQPRGPDYEEILEQISGVVARPNDPSAGTGLNRDMCFWRVWESLNAPDAQLTRDQAQLMNGIYMNGFLDGQHGSSFNRGAFGTDTHENVAEAVLVSIYMLGKAHGNRVAF